MTSADKCPCCNDNEHNGAPQHEIMMTKIITESGAISFLATYYYCPITQEMYEDEDLQKTNMQIIENAAREFNNEQ